MKKTREKVVLWMPVLNEIQGLKQISPLIDKSLFDDILIIDGGSSDGTIEFCQAQGFKVLQQPGKGMPDAMDYAYHKTMDDIIIVFTPDGNSLPELLPELCSKMCEGYDLVIVSRYKGSAKSLDDSFLTHIGNKIFTMIVNGLFGGKYTDVLVAYRGYRRTAVEQMKLFNHTKEHWFRKIFFYMNGWELGSSIRAVKLRLSVTEIPGSEPARIGGKRKLSIIKNGLGSLLQIIHDFVYFKRLKN